MACVRTQKNKNNPYVMLDKCCLNCTELSWRAKGLHAYLMSKPDNWRVKMSHLAKASKEGRDALAKTFKELEEAGYVERKAAHTSDGKLNGWDYTVFETVALKTRDTSNWRLQETDTTNKRENSNNRVQDKPSESGISLNTQPPLEKAPAPEPPPVPAAPSADSPSAGKNGKFDPRLYLEVWNRAYGGRFIVQPVLQAFKAIEAEHSRERVVRALRRYCTETDLRFASIRSFVEKAGSYMPVAPKAERPTPTTWGSNAKESR